MKHQRTRQYATASWIFIWFGTILIVNPRESISRHGVLLWAAGFAIQVFIVARWLIGRPGSSAPVREAKPRRVPVKA